LRHDWALSHEAAETRKNERGLATDEDLTPAAQTWLDRFADELRRVMQGFRAATRTGTIERVVLTGSGALTIGFAERLTELVGVPTQLLPLEDSITASVGSLAATGRESVGFATAIGLALSADSGAIAVNLQPMQGSKREIARLLPRPLVLGLTAGVIAAVVIITAGLQSLNAEKAEKLEGLQKTLKASQNQTKGSDSATLAQKRVAALKKLDGEVRSDATRWLDVMRQLSAQLPDRVSIVEIVMEKQRTVAVRAMTETNDQVADSLRIVRSFSDFTDVRLDYATETLIEGQPVVEFQLLCRLPAPPVRRVQR
jgi:Tfp pilus assembly protein PilN